MLADGYENEIPMNGTQWVYFQYKKGLQPNEYYELTLKASYAMDIFLSSGVNSEPTEFNNDIELRK